MILGTDARAQRVSQKLDDQLKQAQISKIYQEIKAANTVTVATANYVTPFLANNKLGQGTRTSVANILGVMNAAEALAKARPDGKFTGFYPGSGIIDFLTPSALKKNTTIENEGFLDAINLKVQQWASGASLTKQQIDQVNRLVPRKNDSDRTVKTKLNNLANFMDQYIRSSLQSEGIAFEPTAVDLFAKETTLDDIFNN